MRWVDIFALKLAAFASNLFWTRKRLSANAYGKNNACNITCTRNKYPWIQMDFLWMHLETTLSLRRCLLSIPLLLLLAGVRYRKEMLERMTKAGAALTTHVRVSTLADLNITMRVTKVVMYLLGRDLNRVTVRVI
jgi:hypothetical protein